MKGFSSFIVLLLAFAIVVVVGVMVDHMMKNVIVGAEFEKDRESQIFRFIIASIVFFGETLVSVVVSFQRAVLGAISALLGIIVNLILFLTSSVTSTTTTMTTSTTTAAPVTTTPLITSSPLPTTSMMVASTGPITSTVPITTDANTSSGTSMTAPTSSAMSSTATSTTTSSVTTTTTTSTSTSTTSTSTTTMMPTQAPSKIVFVTNETYFGSFGNIAQADIMCSSLAMGASLDGTFLAWISNTSMSPSTRFIQSADPYVLVDGTMIATNYSTLVENGTILNPLNKDQNGGDVPQDIVWTYTDGDGTDSREASVFSCENWSADSSTLVGGTGKTDVVTGQWTQSESTQCSMRARFYCFQQ